MAVIAKPLFFKIFGPVSNNGVSGKYVCSPDDRRVLLALLKSFRPKFVVEFGVHVGHTANLILKRCSWVECYVGVDVPHNNTASNPNPKEKWVPGSAVDDKRFELMVRKNGTFDVTPKDIAGADFIFIDGLHTERAVQNDTQLARSVVKRGVICWHDYKDNYVVDDSVRTVIDRLNKVKDKICRVNGTWICFEIRSAQATI